MHRRAHFRAAPARRLRRARDTCALPSPTVRCVTRRADHSLVSKTDEEAAEAEERIEAREALKKARREQQQSNVQSKQAAVAAKAAAKDGPPPTVRITRSGLVSNRAASGGGLRGSHDLGFRRGESDAVLSLAAVANHSATI